jgi:hypothetical protein
VRIGRTFTWKDIYQDALVAVVSESLARQYWKNLADAIGKRIRVVPTSPGERSSGSSGTSVMTGGLRERALIAIQQLPDLLRRLRPALRCVEHPAPQRLPPACGERKARKGSGLSSPAISTNTRLGFEPIDRGLALTAFEMRRDR